MRVWVDLTNTAHVLVLRPLVERLEAAGHEVELTARPLSHTLELLDDWGHPYTALGRHGGAGRAGKALAAAARVPQLLRFARGRGFDCALAHGSTDLPPVARALRDPEHDDVRLRVGDAPALRQLPAREPRARARRDPGRAARALRRAAAQARALPGAEGGVLPRRLRAGRARARASSGCGATRPLRGRPHRAVVRALPRRLRERAAARRAASGSRGRAPQTVVLARNDEQRRAVRRARASARSSRSAPSTAAAWSPSPTCSSRPAGR